MHRVIPETDLAGSVLLDGSRDILRARKIPHTLGAFLSTGCYCHSIEKSPSFSYDRYRIIWKGNDKEALTLPRVDTRTRPVLSLIIKTLERRALPSVFSGLSYTTHNTRTSLSEISDDSSRSWQEREREKERESR